MIKEKRFEVIYDKIVKIKVEVMEGDLCDEMEDEVLQIFLYHRVANIKVEANNNKNPKEKITMEAKVSKYEAKKI